MKKEVCEECGLIHDSENESMSIKEDTCILCEESFTIGEDGNELGFCCKCQSKKDFPYDLDRYYEAYDAGKEVFKGFETMSRGILEKYRKWLI